jgi:hypothetical protein
MIVCLLVPYCFANGRPTIAATWLSSFGIFLLWGGVLRRLLANDTEQAFLVETPRVRTQWLGGTEERRMFSMGPGECIEGGIDVDVIGHDDAARG